jgi:hypothetical protein
MKRLTLLATVVFVLLLTGCAINEMQTSTSQIATNIQLDKTQYDITGDITGTATAGNVFIFPYGYKWNVGTFLGLFTGCFWDENVRSMAIYNALENSNDADAIITPRYKSNTFWVPIFYSKTTVEVKGKGIKIK